MFCTKCGANIEEGKKFCPNCGAPVETPAVAKAPEPQPASASVTAGIKKLSAKTIGIIAGAAVVVVVLIIILASGGGPTKIVNDYAKAKVTSDYNTIKKYSAIDIDGLIKEAYTTQGMTEKEFKQMLKEEGFSSIDAIFDNQTKIAKENLAKNYGRNYSITVKIVESQKASKSELETAVSYFQTMMGYTIGYGMKLDNIIRFDKITAMTYYDVEVKITGSIDFNEYDYQIVLVKIGGSWKVLDDISDIFYDIL